jgi:hypothetical protein
LRFFDSRAGGQLQAVQAGLNACLDALRSCWGWRCFFVVDGDACYRQAFAEGLQPEFARLDAE